VSYETVRRFRLRAIASVLLKGRTKLNYLPDFAGPALILTMVPASVAIA
jgi:hypothetical protein